MKASVRTLRDIALRATVLLGFYLGASWMFYLFDSSSGANIGAGLLVFVAIMVLSGLGGLYDGRRFSVSRVTVTWSATAVLASVGMIALFDPWPVLFDVDVFVSDLRDVGGFLVGLIAVPALIVGGLTALLHRAERRRTAR